MDQVLFGRWLSQKREEWNLTQAELAKALGVRPTHLAGIESGESEPSISLMEEISAFFHVPLNKLMRNVESLSPSHAQTEVERKIKQLEPILRSLSPEDLDAILDFANYRLKAAKSKKRKTLWE